MKNNIIFFILFFNQFFTGACQMNVSGKYINYLDTNNLKQGYWIEYYSSHSIKSIYHYKNDTMDGTIILFFKNGKINLISEYHLGVKNGEFKLFQPSGCLDTYVLYKNGLPQYMIKYDNDCKISQEYNYENGKVIWGKEYNKDGSYEEINNGSIKNQDKK